MSHELINQLKKTGRVVEGYVFVREVKVYLKTAYDNFHPKVKIRIWFGPDADHLPPYTLPPYTYELSHHFHGPKQAGPYLSSGSFNTEEEAIDKAIDDLFAFMPSPKEYPEPNYEWFVKNESY